MRHTVDLAFWLQSVIHETFIGRFTRDGFDFGARSHFLSHFSAAPVRIQPGNVDVATSHLPDSAHGTRIRDAWMFAIGAAILQP